MRSLTYQRQRNISPLPIDDLVSMQMILNYHDTLVNPHTTDRVKDHAAQAMQERIDELYVRLHARQMALPEHLPTEK